MSNREYIGKRIAEIRQAKGLSIRQLADASGVNFANVYKIENGKYNVSIDILGKICGALEYRVDLVKEMPKSGDEIIIRKSNINGHEIGTKICVDHAIEEKRVIIVGGVVAGTGKRVKLKYHSYDWDKVKEIKEEGLFPTKSVLPKAGDEIVITDRRVQTSEKTKVGNRYKVVGAWERDIRGITTKFVVINEKSDSGKLVRKVIKNWSYGWKIVGDK